MSAGQSSDVRAEPATRPLLVMLPGAGIKAGDFAAHGLVEMAQRDHPALDVATPQPELDAYLDGSIARVLHESVIQPAIAAGRRRIWLLGISLGGMGALLHASAYPGTIEGLILLAPFLGTQGAIAELDRAGGFARWSAQGSTATAPERQMLAWLQQQLQTREHAPTLWLGYGQQDRFAAGHRLLARHLPARQVAEVEGDHDWAAWRTTFAAILARKPLG